MKLEDMFHNNILKKTTTDHQILHYRNEVLVEKFKRMMQRQKLTEADYSKIMDDEETIKRIRADIKKGFIAPDEFNNKKSKKSL